MKRTLPFLLLIAALGFARADPAQGQEVIPSTGEAYFSITPYLWLVNLSLDATLGSRTLETTVSTSDLFDKLQFGAMAYIEAGKNGWGVFVEPNYAGMSDEVTVSLPKEGEQELAWDADQLLLDFGGLRQVHRNVWLYGGVRYFYLDSDFTIGETLENDSSGLSTWNGFIGGRVIASLSQKTQLAVRGDLGFGDSDANGRFRAALAYFFSPSWAFDVGFDYRKDDYLVEGDQVTYGLDTDWYGAVVGATYRR
jgi:hypothetical protein